MDQQKKQNKALKIIGSILGSIFVAICAIIIFFNVTHEYHVIVGDSMYPTLNNNQTDGVFVSKIKSYGRGDIIIANKGEKDSSGKTVYVIKRLIAIGGDKIAVVKQSENYVISLIYKGETEPIVLDEPYLESPQENHKLYETFYNMVRQYSITVDARGYITIPLDQVFYLGDNRDNSLDCATYGPKDKALVVGKVDYIVYGNTNRYKQVLQQVFGG